MIALIQPLIAHLAWLVTALVAGGLLARLVLDRLDPRAPVVLRPGTRHAGRWIGYAERTLIYLAIVAELPWIVPVVIGLKTLVRFPEIQSASRATPPEEPAEGAPPTSTPGSFVEYYLVGTLASLASAVVVGLLARQLVGLGWGSTVFAVLVAGAVLFVAQDNESSPRY